MERRNFLAMLGIGSVASAMGVSSRTVGAAAVSSIHVDPAALESQPISTFEIRVHSFDEPAWIRFPGKTNYSGIVTHEGLMKQPSILDQYNPGDSFNDRRITEQPVGQVDSKVVNRQRKMAESLKTRYTNGATLGQYQRREVNRFGSPRDEQTMTEHNCHLSY